MNIVQNQAIDFLEENYNEGYSYKTFIDHVRIRIHDYNKVNHQVIFMETLLNRIKIEYDEHYKVCTNKKNCETNKFHENVLFFLQEDLEVLEAKISPEDFKNSEKDLINQNLEKILEELKTIKLGQEITYDDLSNEFEELKDLYFLNKKHWSQIFAGKLTEMVGSGVISEAFSKRIIELINENYDNLFS